MEKEKILDKMRELKDRRDFEILENELNIQFESNDKEQDNKVLDVKYIGEAEITKEVDGEKTTSTKGIYLLIEQKKDKNDNLIQIERYYSEDFEFLGGNNRGDGYDLMLSPEHMQDEKLLEQLRELDKQGEFDLNEIEEERLEEIAKELGIDKDDIDKLSEIDLEEIKKIKEKSNDENTEEKEEEDTEEKEKENTKDKEERENIKDKEEKEEEENREEKNKDSEEEQLTKEQVQKISTKTEIKSNQKVTDKETLESILGVQDKGYTKIAIIYSEKLKDNANTTKFSFVGIKSDGSAEKIDSLEQRYGSTPTKEIDALDREGNLKDEPEKVSSIYTIKGKNETQLAIDIGAMGTIEPLLVRTPRQNNQEAISIPIETHSVRPTTRETREFMNETRNPRIKEETERIQEYQEEGFEDIDLDDINDNINDNNIQMTDEIAEKWTELMMENEDIGNVFTEREVKEMVKIYWNKEDKGDKSLEEIKKEIEDEIAEDASNFRRRKNALEKILKYQ